MTRHERQVEQMTRLVRRCFQRLRAAGDALHGDLGINASLRAVMESLYENGDQTVPQIARAKSVSRQHIQVIVDALAALRHVAVLANPAHKRSPLVSLTAQGRRTFEQMRRREADLLAALAADIDAGDVDAALRALAALADALASRTEKESDHDDE